MNCIISSRIDINVNTWRTIIQRILPAIFLLFIIQSFSQSFNAEVLNKESSFVVADGVLNESYYVAIKINNTQGDEYTKVEISYTNENPIYDLEVWIEDINGKVLRKLKNKEIMDISNIDANNLYDDNHVKKFDLKYNIYPYVIKYKYCCKEKKFLSICDYWSPILDYKIPTHAAKLTVDIPVGYKISLFQNKIDAPIKDSVKNRIIMTWQAKYEQPVKAEVCAPTIDELVPFVSIVPVQFNYGIKGSQQDWASFGNWDYNLNKGLDDLPTSEIEKVNELTKGISDKKLIVKLLYQYLQDNTRYVSVQIGVGGFKSFPAGFVADKKYGDCKALSNYMKALLKAVGISSCTVLVNADDKEGAYKIINTFVSSQFNHEILLVPLDKDTMWLDCTSPTNPAGYLGTFTQNRYALVIDENNSRLIKTPSLTPSDCYTLSNNTISIDTSGNALLKSSTICKGAGFDRNSIYSTELNKEKQKEYLYKIIPYQDFEIKQLNIKNEGRDSAIICLNYQIFLKNNVTQSGKYMFLQLNGIKLPEFENPTKRKFPVRLFYPIHYMDTTEIIIPDKYKAKINVDKNIETQYGVGVVKYVIHDNKIEVYRDILVNSGEYSTEEYIDFYQFITKLHEAINTPISFTRNE